MKSQSSFNKLMFIPLVLFLLLVVAFLVQLTRNANGDDPTMLESALIGKPDRLLNWNPLSSRGKLSIRRYCMTANPCCSMSGRPGARRAAPSMNI